MDSLLPVLLFVAFFYLMMRYGCGADMRSGGCGHSSHGHTLKNEDLDNHGSSHVKQLTRDPVCGMEIETERASNSTRYGLVTYYFCSTDCYRKFREKPEYFAEIDRSEKRYIA